VHPAQLGLRFVLEVAALVLIGRGAARQVPEAWATFAALGAPALAAALWVTFAVRGDPSRSGRAPVPVPGPVRLLLEVAVFGAGAVSLVSEGQHGLAVVYGALVVAHHVGTTARLRWLLAQ
jgi:hypothetical protein